jgi:hypothetical protein
MFPETVFRELSRKQLFTKAKGFCLFFAIVVLTFAEPGYFSLPSYYHSWVRITWGWPLTYNRKFLKSVCFPRKKKTVSAFPPIFPLLWTNPMNDRIWPKGTPPPPRRREHHRQTVGLGFVEGSAVSNQTWDLTLRNYWSKKVGNETYNTWQLDLEIVSNKTWW